MRKILIVAILVIVLSMFMSSNKSNKETFFKPTNDLKIFHFDNDFEIKKIYIQITPEFYQTSIYKEKGELTLQKTLENEKDTTQLCYPTIYGWQVANYEGPLMFSAKSITSLVVDNTKTHTDKLSMRLFDFKNNLAYSINKETVLTCNKVEKNGDINVSWSLKLPSFNLRQTCKRTIEGNIVVFGTKDIIVIDTAKVKIRSAFKFGKNQTIFDVIPLDNKLFIITVNLEGSFDMRTNFKDLYSLYVINIYENVPLKFTNSKRLRNVMHEQEFVVVRDKSTFFVIDNSLFTNEINLSDIHKDGIMETSFKSSASVESDVLTFKIKDKEYIFNKDNPYELREIPQDLEALNTFVGGDNWDYCFFEDGYCCGFDIKSGEKTWKIKTDMQPYYSSEFGVLFTENDRILYYSKKH
jgi:hypothetical protein